MTLRVDNATLATMSEAELARTLEIPAEELAEVEKTILRNPTSTIQPSRLADALGRRALEGLGAQADARQIRGGLDIDRTIGEGGMGIVRLATQRSLGRMVAVKTLRAEAKTDEATLRLLREAWVTGSLEHPNIVPVYDLGLDEDGSPIIVLKRSEGVEWATLLRDPGELHDRVGEGDPLEHNLRILISVCNAVSLAHARGIVHRDLKPENVMIGRFGEVYLVDWGIAVSLRPDPSGRLLLASEATEIAGTPAYMAPEMLGAVGTLSERTDIYQLGAILHEILTGEPPHRGASFREMVTSVLLSTFEYAPEQPRALVEIARKAMSREPDDRFASADELRGRLEWYLRHRGSLALSDEASRRLVQMREVMTLERIDAALRERLYRFAAEARFGFRQALVACDDNEAASRGLRETNESVVTFELERGTAEAAAAALAQIDDPPEALSRRVREALDASRRERARVAQLESLGADLDPATGRRTRVFLTGVLGIVFSIAPQVCRVFAETHPGVGPSDTYAFTLSLVVFTALLLRWARSSMSKTAMNRGIIAAGAIMFAGQLALEVGASFTGMPFYTMLVQHLLLWFVCLAFVSALVERRLLPAAFVMLGAYLAASARPSWVWHLMSAADCFLLVNFVFAWGPDEARATQSRRPPPKTRRAK